MESNGQPSFLYVEDDLSSRKVIEVLIKCVLGYQNVMIYENSQNFMAKIEALPWVPDVAFLDVQISPLDGYEMLGMLRSDPRFAKTTIIAMTANVMSYDVDKLRRAGFNGLIGKPILKESFPDLVQRVLAGESIWYVP
jgi:CheY-like chemotaxis protein